MERISRAALAVLGLMLAPGLCGAEPIRWSFEPYGGTVQNFGETLNSENIPNFERGLRELTFLPADGGTREGSDAVRILSGEFTEHIIRPASGAWLPITSTYEGGLILTDLASGRSANFQFEFFGFGGLLNGQPPGSAVLGRNLYTVFPESGSSQVYVEVTPAPLATPEPSTLALASTGLACAALVARRRVCAVSLVNSGGCG